MSYVRYGKIIMKIPKQPLAEYRQSHIMSDYDLTPELREQHNEKMILWRKNKK